MVRLWTLAACWLVCTSGAGDAAAQAAAGPAPEAISLGMSTALTGPAAQLGLDMRQGVLAAFEEANRSGGVHGVKIRLIALDDGYEPNRTIPNMHRLIDEDRVVAIIGNVGTPTAIAAVPIAEDGRTLLFGAFTGAGVLRRDPPDRYVINYRASYAQETAAMVDALVDDAGLKPEEIGFFTQRDGYGDAGYAGGIAAMQRHGLTDHTPIAHGRYERNTTAVENGLADILGARAPPKAVIMVGAYEPCAEFIRVADEFGFHPLLLSVSFVGSQALADELGPLGDGVVITQVVPPCQSHLPICGRYELALAALSPDARPSYTSLEGYIAGTIMADALRRIDGPITRESVIDSLEGLADFDIGLGAPLHLDPEHHQASDTVWPTVIRHGEVVPFQWPELRALVKEAGP